MSQGLEWEQIVTQGLAMWLICLRYDPATKSVYLVLTPNPEKNDNQSAWWFREVDSCTSNWFDQDESSMESFVGGSESLSGGAFYYTIRTDQREVLITSQVSAVIESESFEIR